MVLVQQVHGLEQQVHRLEQQCKSAEQQIGILEDKVRGLHEERVSMKSKLADYMHRYKKPCS